MTTESRYIRFIPNTLSALRIILALAFPFSPQATWFLLILCAASSDALDGWIARRWQVQSRLGGLLDAVADKLFMLVALVTVAVHGAFSPWWVLPILARDLLVAGTAIYAAVIRSWGSFLKMEVKWLGKLATGSQFLLLLAAVLHDGSVPAMLLITILLSLAAAGHYGWLFILELHRRAAAELSA